MIVWVALKSSSFTILSNALRIREVTATGQESLWDFGNFCVGHEQNYGVLPKMGNSERGGTSWRCKKICQPLALHNSSEVCHLYYTQIDFYHIQPCQQGKWEFNALPCGMQLSGAQQGLHFVFKVNHNNVKFPLIKTDSPLVNNVFNRFRHPWLIIWKNFINLLEIIKMYVWAKLGSGFVSSRRDLWTCLRELSERIYKLPQWNHTKGPDTSYSR